MTPAEGAYYLGVPNIIMVQCRWSQPSPGDAWYERFEPPFEQHAVALRPFRRVAWSVVGSGGFNDRSETNEILRLAAQMPNFAGVMLDDFFTGRKDGPAAFLTLDELRRIRRVLASHGRNQEIFTTLYYRFIDLPLREYLDLIDVITLWGSADDLRNLEAHLSKVEKAAPKQKKMLGCYMFDFGKKEPLPAPLMKLQCETGLRWLKERRIEGMIFLGNTVADLEFPSVEWTRKWIADVGETKL